jgi:hypothetical protein
MLFNFFKTTISVKNYIVVGIGARKHKNKLGLLMEVQEEIKVLNKWVQA